jgi:hypothetical protein
MSMMPETEDLLQSTKFRLTFSRLPGITFFCQTANLPGISLTEGIRNTPFVDVYYPGEKAIYDTFNVTFLVDEQLSSWIQLHDWIRGLTFPTDFKEYKDLKTKFLAQQSFADPKARFQYSDATLNIYTNKNNPNIRINFSEIFPVSLGALIFSTSDTAENIVISDATFRFAYYNIQKV